MLDRPASRAQAGVVLMLGTKALVDVRYGMWRAKFVFLAILLTAPEVVLAQGGNDIKELKLRDWQPRSMLVTKATTISKPAFPAVDVHNHLGGGKATLTPERVSRYLAEMDAAGVRTVVNLDGGWGDRLKETISALDDAHPGRFLTYALIDFPGSMSQGGRIENLRGCAASFEAGAKGLKFHKMLGLGSPL